MKQHSSNHSRLRRSLGNILATIFFSATAWGLYAQSETSFDPQQSRLDQIGPPDASVAQMVERLQAEPPRAALLSGNPEICNNGIDDDGDGWIDNLDGDCSGMVPFDCDGKLYQTMNPQNVWKFFSVQTNPVVFTLIQQLSGQIPSFPGINSIAFNPVDRYIYGINPNSPFQLFRLDAGGNLQVLGNITGLVNGSFAGTMDFNGNYYVTGGHGRLYLVDIYTRVATFVGVHGLTTADIAYSPADGQLYGWNAGNDRLYRINPTNAAPTPIGPADNRFGGFGALYFNAQGEIIAYGDNVNITGTSQETLVKMNPNTGIITILGTGPGVSGNDGCSCSFGLEMTKATSTSITSTGQTFSYTFTLFNEGFSTLNSMAFNDVLPAGLSFASEPYAVSGMTIGSTAITGGSVANFNIDNLAPNSSGSFVVDVTVTGDFSCTGGTLPNQASLGNLPAYFGGDVLSDDPATAAITDPTVVTVTGDTLAPSITCPNDITISCTDSPNSASVGQATATDNCGPITLSSTDLSTPGSCAQASDILRTWTATDGAGNVSSCSQNIHIVDNVAPVITTCPSNEQWSCVADITAANVALIQGNDNCDPSPVASLLSETDNGGTGCEGDPLIIDRVYALTDACGNSSTCHQQIYVEADPILISAVVTNSTCSNTLDGAIDLSASSSCGNLSFAWSNGASTEDLSNLGGGTYTVTVSTTYGCSAIASYTVLQSAPVVVDAGDDTYVFPAWQDSSCVTLNGSATGGDGNFSYSWTVDGSNTVIGTGSSIQVCPSSTTTYCLTAVDGFGCESTDCITVCALDITCSDRSNNGVGGNGQSGNGVNQSGNAQQHIAICHVPPGNPANAMTKCIPVTAAPQHVGQHAGDYLGACGMVRSCTSGNRMGNIAYEGEGSIKASPNPFGNTANIVVVFETEEEANLRVFDASGRIVQEISLGVMVADQAISVKVGETNWAAGLYLVEVKTASGKSLSTRIMRQ